MVQDWTGGRNTPAKVPTKILYTNAGDPKCGYEISDTESPLEWFKLLLLNDDEFPAHIRESKDFDKIKDARKRLNKEGRDEIAVVADYLRYLWRRAEESIKKSRNSTVVNASIYVVVLTHPAIWPAHACQKMRRAAEQAGIADFRRAGPTTLHLVSEPEAAALATYEDAGGHHHFHVGLN